MYWGSACSDSQRDPSLPSIAASPSPVDASANAPFANVAIFENAFDPILVTVDGIKIVVNPSQLLNEFDPIVVTLFNVIELNLLQPLNE